MRIDIARRTSRKFERISCRQLSRGAASVSVTRARGLRRSFFRKKALERGEKKPRICSRNAAVSHTRYFTRTNACRTLSPRSLSRIVSPLRPLLAQTRARVERTELERAVLSFRCSLTFARLPSLSRSLSRHVQRDVFIFRLGKQDPVTAHSTPECALENGGREKCAHAVNEC